MRKNRMMRTASGLLVAVLMTTSIISGTFAKYVTQNDGSDSARVAKWGVVITAGGDLYGENYETGSVPSIKTSATELSVMHEDTSDNLGLVAPGTKSENGMSFSITGEPEVRTKVDITVSAQDIYLAAGTYAVMQPVTVTATTFEGKVSRGIYTESTGTYTKVDAGATFNNTIVYYELSNRVELDVAYYPVQYSSNKTNVTAKNATEIAKQTAKLVNASATDSDTSVALANFTTYNIYAPNTNLSEALNLADNTISWEWKFEVDDNTNAKDTILGDLIAKKTVVSVASDESVTVLKVDDNIVKNGSKEVGSLVTSFGFEITATQVD